MKERLRVNNKMIIYNAGGPRTGNQRWADYVMKLFPKGHFYRIVQGWDIISHMPPTEFLNYSHAGTEVWYPGRGIELDHKICYNEPGKRENQQCANTLGPHQNTFLPDHLISVGIRVMNLICFEDYFLAE
jgi:hypothetical protein